MADHAWDDEVFEFANTEFTREDLVQALNDMVHEYKTLSHTFEEIKAENVSLKNSSAESSSNELENTDILKTELSRLKIENDLLRNEASELKAEVDKLTKEMSSWNQSTRSLQAGPDFWRSSCRLSLFLNKMKMPAPAIPEIFVPHVSFIEPVQYWTAVPWMIRIWQWTKVCEEIVQFSMFGGLRPVREDICQDITVYNLGVERIPADFLRIFAQGVACHSFVDSVVQRDLGDIQEVVLTDVEENDWRLALGPAILSRFEQEERLYFVQSPESPPAISPHHASSSSSTDVSMHFDSTDVPVNAQADTQASASVDFTKFTEALEDLRSSLAQLQVLLRQSFETACRVLERQSTTQTTQITDLKKGLMATVGTIFQDLFDIKKKQREQDARLITMDEQIAAIRSEHLDFQSKIAADILSLSTQVGDIADYLRGGAAKKGEIGSSSRPSTVRTQTQTFPPTTGTFEERVEQARRHILETGQVISIEEAAERVIEADRRESDSFRKQLVQLDIVCFNRFDDVSHSRISYIMTSPSYSATTFPTDMMTSAVLKFQGTVHSSSSMKDLSIEMISGASIKLIQIRSYTQLEKIDGQNKNHSYCLKLRRRRRFQRECTHMETIFASLTKRNLPYNGAGLTAYYCQEFKKDLLPYLDSSTVERRL
ncbi:hypothetical protein F511_14095 [Dorcoceras hygrometricum]|uniref:Uncharacterized protein n=1 Tax=Dorcoceras hygrometricum TaxID=472368 RepID=A0A2Z7CHW9_9LAMI|nr:hypothetical protein F511_14095 [Dorcoceras hygrometricum]